MLYLARLAWCTSRGAPVQHQLSITLYVAAVPARAIAALHASLPLMLYVHGVYQGLRLFSIICWPAGINNSAWHCMLQQCLHELVSRLALFWPSTASRCQPLVADIGGGAAGPQTECL
jgi:hypothetical protein